MCELKTNKNPALVAKLIPCAFLIFFFTGCTSTPKIVESESFLGELILESAKSQLGKRYRFGGTSPGTGFDCSGLSWYSHKQNGINIPRISSDQFKKGIQVLRKNLSPGDLVFFETYRRGVSHVGIYQGNDSFIHALNRNKNVMIHRLSDNYYKKRYLGARRYW